MRGKGVSAPRRRSRPPWTTAPVPVVPETRACRRVKAAVCQSSAAAVERRPLQIDDRAVERCRVVGRPAGLLLFSRRRSRPAGSQGAAWRTPGAHLAGKRWARWGTRRNPEGPILQAVPALSCPSRPIRSHLVRPRQGGGHRFEPSIAHDRSVQHKTLVVAVLGDDRIPKTPVKAAPRTISPAGSGAPARSGGWHDARGRLREHGRELSCGGTAVTLTGSESQASPVLPGLGEADRAMRVGEAHAAVEALLGRPVSRDSVSRCLSAGARAARLCFVCVARGRYQLARAH